MRIGNRLFRDPAFRAGDIDIQLLERRADLLAPPDDSDQIVRIAIAAALAEDDARGVRRQTVGGASTTGSSAWLREGRVEGLR